MDFLKEIVKEVGGEYTQLAADIDDSETYVDTGSYIFNGLVSGSVFGGVSGNKITAIAGESSTGKTFFVSSLSLKIFLIVIPMVIVYILTLRQLLTSLLLADRGIDLNRVVVLNVVTIEQFRSQALKAVDIYLKKKEEDRKPCMFVLDSLGMLSTEKEITDALNDKQVRDMTKSQLVKGAFRMLTLARQANIPMIVTNHTYDVIGSYVPTKEMGGGSGLKYAASTIIYLSKKKEKDGTEIVGNLIKAKTAKSRLSKENKDVTVRLYYDERGLDRYYGLLDLGEIGGLWKNVAGRYEIDGKKVYAKEIYKNPDKYFTEEVMQQLDTVAKKEFSYGE